MQKCVCTAVTHGHSHRKSERAVRPQGGLRRQDAAFGKAAGQPVRRARAQGVAHGSYVGDPEEVCC